MKLCASTLFTTKNQYPTIAVSFYHNHNQYIMTCWLYLLIHCKLHSLHPTHSCLFVTSCYPLASISSFAVHHNQPAYSACYHAHSLPIKRSRPLFHNHYCDQLALINHPRLRSKHSWWVVRYICIYMYINIIYVYIYI